MSLKAVMALAIFVAGLSTQSAQAIVSFIFHDPVKGCRKLIHQIHPDFEGAPFDAEMHKCVRDPQGYIDASGLSPPVVH